MVFPCEFYEICKTRQVAACDIAKWRQKFLNPVFLVVEVFLDEIYWTNGLIRKLNLRNLIVESLFLAVLLFLRLS